MKHFVMDSNETFQGSAAWSFYFSGRRACTLDIETTGLDPRRARFILGGLLDLQSRKLHQIFAEDPAEEADVLKAYMDLLSGFDLAVTYNGRHFDLPFLAERIRRTGTDAAAASCYDLDLYQMVNGHSPLRRLLPNLRQKTLENYMGLWTDRTDEISGAESVDLYHRFVRDRDPEDLRRILLHNSDDVGQLARLLPVLHKCDVDRAMYAMGFPVGPAERRWQVRRIRTVGSRLMAEGVQAGERIPYRSFGSGEDPLMARFDSGAGDFHIELPIVRQRGIAAADIRSLGLKEKEFEKYPGFGSGFLVIQGGNEVKYRQVNHLVKALMDRLAEDMKYRESI